MSIDEAPQPGCGGTAPLLCRAVPGSAPATLDPRQQPGGRGRPGAGNKGEHPQSNRS
jgi:hypothetical protein